MVGLLLRVGVGSVLIVREGRALGLCTVLPNYFYDTIATSEILIHYCFNSCLCHRVYAFMEFHVWESGVVLARVTQRG